MRLPFRWVFGSEFGGFPNPPHLSISISRCDNYSYFPYHYLKNYKFKYSFFGGLQIHRTSAATENTHCNVGDGSPHGVIFCLLV